MPACQTCVLTSSTNILRAGPNISPIRCTAVDVVGACVDSLPNWNLPSRAGATWQTRGCPPAEADHLGRNDEERQKGQVEAEVAHQQTAAHVAEFRWRRPLRCVVKIGLRRPSVTAVIRQTWHHQPREV